MKTSYGPKGSVAANIRRSSPPRDQLLGELAPSLPIGARLPLGMDSD